MKKLRHGAAGQDGDGRFARGTPADLQRHCTDVGAGRSVFSSAFARLGKEQTTPLECSSKGTRQVGCTVQCLFERRERQPESTTIKWQRGSGVAAAQAGLQFLSKMRVTNADCRSQGVHAKPCSVAALRCASHQGASSCNSHAYLQGEDELRHVCSSCTYVEYLNPKMVVGCLVEHQGKVLLCRRALEPCSGLWTLPAGYLELHESSAEGAARETWEEARAKVTVLGPYAHLDIPVIGQVCRLPSQTRSSHSTAYAMLPSAARVLH
jgi:hypothetical protein